MARARKPHRTSGAARKAPGEPDRCPVCGSKDLLQITLTLLDGQVGFTHCSHCEWSEWDRLGKPLSLDAILTQVPPSPRARGP